MDIPLDCLEDNPFNSRLTYSNQQIELLAHSIETHGQLSPIKVRHAGDKYQLVFGHRRVRAMRLLKRPMIRAEICEISNEAMLELSYAENIARADLSDFEKALYFDKMNREFGRTYEEIGSVYDLSKAQICNYIRMTRLFDKEILSRDSSIAQYLVKITERHARALHRVHDSNKRLDLLKSIVESELSVRDLERMITGFRGWLDADASYEPLEHEEGIVNYGRKKRGPARVTSFRRDVLELRNALESEFRLPGDYQSFLEIFAKDPEYHLFSIYAGGPLKVGSEALKIEEDWFHSIGRGVISTIKDFQTRFFGNIAIATCCLDVEASSNPKVSTGSYGGTIVFLNRHRRWKILHEHWSKITPSAQFEACLPGKTYLAPPIVQSFSR